MNSISIQQSPWTSLKINMVGQEEIIRRMNGFDRSAWLAQVTGGARRQVRFAIQSFSDCEREMTAGGGCVY
jgi:hypothetical protein